MRRAAFYSIVLLPLAACADSNPMEWGKTATREVSNIFSSATPPEAEPPAAEGRPYPNLATVPRRPRESADVKAQREADLARLTRDRDKALADDQVLRSTGALPPPEAPRDDAAPAAPPPVSSPGAAAAPMPPVPSPAVPPPSVAAAPAPTPVPPVPAAVPAAVSAQRVGAVSFARDAAVLTATAQRSLAEAAALARPNNGRVRLVAAQTARQMATTDLARARLDAITRALAASGIPAARVAIDEALGRRVDLYDVYVER